MEFDSKKVLPWETQEKSGVNNRIGKKTIYKLIEEKQKEENRFKLKRQRSLCPCPTTAPTWKG